jgi:hypothetical protein
VGRLSSVAEKVIPLKITSRRWISTKLSLLTSQLFYGSNVLVATMEATSISVVVTVGANQYTIWDEFEGFIDPSIFSDNAPAYLPATAVISTKDNFNDKDLSHITSLFSSDDVWNKHFTYGRPSPLSVPWP